MSRTRRLFGGVSVCSVVVVLAAGCAAPSELGKYCADLAQLTTSYATTVTTELSTLDEQPEVSAARIAAAGDAFHEASSDVGGENDVAAGLREGVDGISSAATAISDAGLTEESRAALESAIGDLGETAPGLIGSCIPSASPTPTP